MRKAVTIYLDLAAYRRLKMLVRQLEGREYDPLESVDYGALKQEFERLLREAERMERMLQKRGTYRRLIAVTADIEEELGTKDLKIVAPELFDRWDEAKEDAHLFISLLETLKNKKKIEKQLEEIRRRGQKS